MQKVCEAGEWYSIIKMTTTKEKVFNFRELLRKDWNTNKYKNKNTIHRSLSLKQLLYD